MKKADLVTSLAFVPVDYVMLTAAGMTGYVVRFQGIITRYRPAFFDYPLADFLPSLLLIALVGVIIFAFSGSYRIESSYRTGAMLSKVVLGVSTTLLLVIVVIFLKRELLTSRFIVVASWFIAIVYVYIGRFILIKLKSYFLKRGVGIHHLVLIGTGQACEELVRYFSSHKELGYRVTQRFDSLDGDTQKEIDILHHTEPVDEILETRDIVDREALLSSLNFCHEHGINFRYVASIAQTKLLNFETDNIAGYPVVQINKTTLAGWGKIIKRTFDILISAIILMITSPLFLIVAILIAGDSPGPVFVKLKRVGRGGKIFELYKFRSMIKNAHAMKAEVAEMNERNDGPLFKIKNDPRITRLGRLLRRSSIDELPQFWNVLQGSMSLVGPRPHEPEEVMRYQEKYRTLLNIKPGITGLSQVSGRSNLAFEEEGTLDTYYIENWSLVLDLRIFLKTFVVIFKFDDAA